MSAQATFSVSLAISGLASEIFQSTITDDSSSVASNGATPMPAAKAGELTTRTDADTGVVTLSEGHGITTGMFCDVFWDGGLRYNMEAAVSDEEVTLDGGGGDNLPDEDTEVTVCEHSVKDIGFDPDTMTLLFVKADKRAAVVFVDEDDNVLLALDLVPNSTAERPGMLWHNVSGLDQPMTGARCAAVWISNGDAEYTNNVAAAVLYHTA